MKVFVSFVKYDKNGNPSGFDNDIIHLLYLPENKDSLKEIEQDLAENYCVNMVKIDNMTVLS